MAAGFVMDRANLEKLQEKLTAIARETLGDCQPIPVLKIDAEAHPTDLMGETYRSLAALEPFGFGNPKPVFLARHIKIQQASRVGREGKHLKLGLWDGRASWAAFAFRQGERQLPEDGYLDVAYSFSVNSWKGRRTIELKVADLRPSNQR
jgi:single-stranded-DNA-specific exonuclease